MFQIYYKNIDFQHYSLGEYNSKLGVSFLVPQNNMDNPI